MSFLSSRTVLIVLTLITAAVHLMLGLQPDSALFLLNGIGYLVLLFLAFFTPGSLKAQAGLFRMVLMAYALVTIVAYFLNWGMDGFTQVLGMITKIVELLLVIGLWQSRGKAGSM
jgi:hypothetical protein